MVGAKMLPYRNQQMIILYSFGLASSGNPEIEEMPTENTGTTSLRGNLIALDTTWEDATAETYLLCISIELCQSNFSNLSQAAKGAGQLKKQLKNS